MKKLSEIEKFYNLIPLEEIIQHQEIEITITEYSPDSPPKAERYIPEYYPTEKTLSREILINRNVREQQIRNFIYSQTERLTKLYE